MFPAELSDRYNCQSLLGQGGFGAVYRAIDKRTNKLVAIKICSQSAPNQLRPADETTLLSEANILKGLNHPNIVKYYDSGIVRRADAAFSFLVEELLVGTTLEKYLDLNSKRPLNDPLTIRTKIAILRQIAEALCYMHSRDIIYADLSAKNVMLDEALNVTLIDFDIAFYAKCSEVSGGMKKKTVGTSAYMSPERISTNGVFDLRDDIYAFGILVYQTITHTLPFGVGTDAGTRIKHLVAEMPQASRACDLPAGLDVIIGICTEKKTEDRYDSFKEIVDALRAIENKISKKRPFVDCFVSLLQKFLIQR